MQCVKWLLGRVPGFFSSYSHVKLDTSTAMNKIVQAYENCFLCIRIVFNFVILSHFKNKTKRKRYRLDSSDATQLVSIIFFSTLLLIYLMKLFVDYLQKSKGEIIA